MNEELINQAQTALATMIQTLIDSGEWVAEQVPLVVKELLIWQCTISGIVAGCAAIVTLTLVFWPARKYAKFCEETFSAKIDIGEYIFLWGVLGVTILISTFITIVNICTCIKVLIAPRLFLLEYAADLVKGG